MASRRRWVVAQRLRTALKRSTAIMTPDIGQTRAEGTPSAGGPITPTSTQTTIALRLAVRTRRTPSARSACWYARSSSGSTKRSVRRLSRSHPSGKAITQVYGRFCEVRVARCGTALGDEEALGAFVLLRSGSSIGCGRGFLQVACLDHGWSAVSLLPSRLKPDRTLFPDEVQDRQVGRPGHLYGLDPGLGQRQRQHRHQRAKIRLELAAHLLSRTTNVTSLQRLAIRLCVLADSLLIHELILSVACRGREPLSPFSVEARSQACDDGRRRPGGQTEEPLHKAPPWLPLRPPPPARSDRNEREGPRVARREGREPWPGHVRQRLPSGRSSHGWSATSRWVNCDAASMLRGRTSRSGWQSAWPRGQSLRADRQPATAEQSRSGSLGVPVPR